MTRDELLRLARRLTDGHEARPSGGRPRAEARNLVERYVLAGVLYRGIVPALYFEADDDRLRAAKGSWSESDALAAEVLGLSERTIRSAREAQTAIGRDAEIERLCELFAAYSEHQERELAAAFTEAVQELIGKKPA